MKKITTLFYVACSISLSLFGNLYGSSISALKQQPKFQNDSVHKIPLSHSILATGDWYRFYVDKTGVFKITPQFITSLGMNLSKIDPARIKIYGNGGQMLPLKNKENTYFDLQQNPIKIVGGEDGEFSGNDHILFYGQGTQVYNEDSKTYINCYEDKSYYFITASAEPEKRIANFVPSKKPTTKTITSFEENQFYEVDNTNIALMGRRWVGDALDSGKEKEFHFYIPNRVVAQPVTCSVVVAAQSIKSSEMNVAINTLDIGKIQISARSKNMAARSGQLNKTIQVPSDSINIKLRLENNGETFQKSFLDFIKIKSQRYLKGTTEQFTFSTAASNNKEEVGEVIFTDAYNTDAIWEITNPNAIKSIENHIKADSIQFKIACSQQRKFIAFSNKDLYPPLKTENTQVKNQDLKGTIFLNKQGDFADVDYLIITTTDLISAAEKLANFRRSKNNIHVKVIDVGQIYNEFSSGKQDIGAIRNFIRYVYDNASEETKKLKYVCLIGDATIDYKNILKENSKAIRKVNKIPSFESYESFSNASSFVSDDFFVMMDPEDGLVKPKDQLDIAIGRILASDLKTANQMVDKIIGYYGAKSHGAWRNNILLLSDDVDKAWERQLQENLNQLGDTLAKKYPFLNLSKIYTDAYKQEKSPNGEKYPIVTKELVKTIEKGVVVMDYFGHAKEDGLGTEFFFTKTDAKKLKNKDKLPLLITVTCLATRFDNPTNISIGEHFFKNPVGGAIGLIATTREIYYSAGVKINKKIIEYLFSEKGAYLKPADALVKMKNEVSFNDKRSVFFIGDPVMSIQIPKPKIVLTKINETPTEKFTDILKALSSVKLSGEVRNQKGEIEKNYHGVATVTLYDKQYEKSTLANNYSEDSKGALIKLKFRNQGALIFRGNALVKNGKFTLKFIIPKDIDMSIGICKISMYSKNNNGADDRSGAVESVQLGGVEDQSLIDIEGPNIQLLLDHKEVKSNKIVGSSSELQVVLEDKNGVNVSSGIGHQIQMVLDNNENKPIILNDFYENSLDTYQKGTIRYKFQYLKQGHHTIKIKAWDTFNNSAVKKINFIVIDSLQ